MLFKFPKKKIVLDCFTTEHYVAEYAPIVPAMKLIPVWWKELPNSYPLNTKVGRQGTMRNCVGMVDYYKNSIAIPAWSELEIKIFDNGTYVWQFADLKTSAVVHDIKKQATSFLNNYGHLKINSPWAFKTKENISWVWTAPTYNYSDTCEIISLPAVVNYHYQNTTAINLLFPLSQEKLILIPHKRPLALITPMSDRKVEIVRHVISKEEMEKISNKQTSISFIRKYSEIIKSQEFFKDCPFHTKK